VLFDNNGNPRDPRSIEHKVTGFSRAYDTVVKKIIPGSIKLDKRSFKSNVATLLPSFGMTRNNLFRRLRIENNVVKDPNKVLDICWIEVKDELQKLKKEMSKNSFDRSRAILELDTESTNLVISDASELFEKLEWTVINDSRIGRVGASKILFANLPELALPVDNAEWDHVFCTHSYGRVLSTMIEEIKDWERNSKTHFETLDSKLPTTVTSIYNVMAMSKRP
jgi:hypothetical protein